MKLNLIRSIKLCSLVFFLVSSLMTVAAQDKTKIEGRWDLEIEKDGEKLPSWLEIRLSGRETQVGRFVYASGSARPISDVKWENGSFHFSIPPQWEAGKNDLVFSGNLVNNTLQGTMIFTDGKKHSWTGVRAPTLPYNSNPKKGKTIALFNGKDLDGWHANEDNQWKVVSGVLTSAKAGSNLISDEKFKDFNLKVEFRYPEGSNSGIYLRGRYEVQIADNYGDEPSDIKFGGVYGFLTPNEMAAKQPGEWQSFDITLIGHRVSIIANGKAIIVDQTIPGITGGALDSKEGLPGPLFIQGDHGPVEFRKVEITPLH